MKGECPICHKKNVIVFYEKEIIIFPVIDNKRSSKYYPCCSKECLDLLFYKEKSSSEGK